MRRVTYNKETIQPVRRPVIQTKEQMLSEKHSIESPTRGQLGKKHWAEWGEGVRRLKVLGHSNPKGYSLQKVRDALHIEELNSIQRAVNSLGN